MFFTNVFSSQDACQNNCVGEHVSVVSKAESYTESGREAHSMQDGDLSGWK